MDKVKTEIIKWSAWSMVGGAGICMIIGFWFGGWTLGSTVKKMSEQAAENAVIEQLAPICVAQFSQDPQRDDKLKELKEKSSWERDRYVEKQGWATMPGAKGPVRGVAGECARRILK